MGVPRIPITASADKYDWPPINPVVYGGGIELRQVSDRVFMLIGLRQNHLRHKDFLMGQLKRRAPVDTGRLQRSYDVYPMEYQANLWALIITNRMTYFKFAYHFYRGEIAQNHSFIRDFIQDAVDPVVRKMGAKIPPTLKSGETKPILLPKKQITAKGKIPPRKEIKEVAKKVEQKRMPKLAEGKTYGATMTISDVRVGDKFRFIGDQSMGSIGGQITKINRDTIEYKSPAGSFLTIQKKVVLKSGLTYIVKQSSPKTVHPFE